jgi:hypothetical protein
MPARLADVIEISKVLPAKSFFQLEIRPWGGQAIRARMNPAATADGATSCAQRNHACSNPGCNPQPPILQARSG